MLYCVSEFIYKKGIPCRPRVRSSFVVFVFRFETQVPSVACPRCRGVGDATQNGPYDRILRSLLHRASDAAAPISFVSLFVCNSRRFSEKFIQYRVAFQSRTKFFFQ